MQLISGLTMSSQLCIALLAVFNLNGESAFPFGKTHSLLCLAHVWLYPGIRVLV